MIPWRDLNGRVVRVLRGVKLPCGCLAGIYETYAATTVTIIDEAHDGCRLAQHRNGHMLSSEAREALAPDASRW
jgi:hypothetical protein